MGAPAIAWLLTAADADPSYEFNAPQFHDFVNARDDPIAAESYFEKDGRRMTLLQGGSAPASQGKESSPAISQPGQPVCVATPIELGLIRPQLLML